SLVGLLSSFTENFLKDLLHTVGSQTSFSTTVLMGVVASALNIFLALFMLRGANWARIIYLCVSTFFLVGMLVLYARIPSTILIVTAAKLLVFGSLLLQPQARQFFSSPPSVVQHDVAG